MWRREDLRGKKTYTERGLTREGDIQEEGTYTEGKHTLKHTHTRKKYKHMYKGDIYGEETYMEWGLTKTYTEPGNTRRGNLHGKKTYVERDIHGKETPTKRRLTRKKDIYEDIYRKGR